MLNLLVAGFLFGATIVMGWVMIKESARLKKEKGKAKAKLDKLKELNILATQVSMYKQANTLLDLIKNIETYKQVCMTEEAMNDFIEIYKHTPKFSLLIITLNTWFTFRKKVVRAKDKPIIPFDFIYTEE